MTDRAPVPAPKAAPFGSIEDVTMKQAEAKILPVGKARVVAQKTIMDAEQDRKTLTDNYLIQQKRHDQDRQLLDSNYNQTLKKLNEDLEASQARMTQLGADAAAKAAEPKFMRNIKNLIGIFSDDPRFDRNMRVIREEQITEKQKLNNALRAITRANARHTKARTSLFRARQDDRAALSAATTANTIRKSDALKALEISEAEAQARALTARIAASEASTEASKASTKASETREEATRQDIDAQKKTEAAGKITDKELKDAIDGDENATLHDVEFTPRELKVLREERKTLKARQDTAQLALENEKKRQERLDVVTATDKFELDNKKRAVVVAAAPESDLIKAQKAKQPLFKAGVEIPLAMIKAELNTRSASRSTASRAETAARTALTVEEQAQLELRDRQIKDALAKTSKEDLGVGATMGITTADGLVISPSEVQDVWNKRQAQDDLLAANDLSLQAAEADLDLKELSLESAKMALDEASHVQYTRRLNTYVKSMDLPDVQEAMQKNGWILRGEGKNREAVQLPMETLVAHRASLVAAKATTAAASVTHANLATEVALVPSKMARLERTLTNVFPSGIPDEAADGINKSRALFRMLGKVGDETNPQAARVFTNEAMTLIAAEAKKAKTEAIRVVTAGIHDEVTKNITIGLIEGIQPTRADALVALQNNMAAEGGLPGMGAADVLQKSHEAGQAAAIAAFQARQPTSVQVDLGIAGPAALNAAAARILNDIRGGKTEINEAQFMLAYIPAAQTEFFSGRNSALFNIIMDDHVFLQAGIKFEDILSKNKLTKKTVLNPGRALAALSEIPAGFSEGAGDEVATLRDYFLQRAQDPGVRQQLAMAITGAPTMGVGASIELAALVNSDPLWRLQQHVSSWNMKSVALTKDAEAVAEQKAQVEMQRISEASAATGFDAYVTTVLPVRHKDNPQKTEIMAATRQLLNSSKPKDADLSNFSPDVAMAARNEIELINSLLAAGVRRRDLSRFTAGSEPLDLHPKIGPEGFVESVKKALAESN